MQTLEQQGIYKQEAVVLSLDRKKLKDLEYLKKQTPSGPFISSDDIDLFMSTYEEPERRKRLYIEVRYAKHSTSNLKRSNNIFRLKKNGKMLDSEDYVHNLKVYFGCINAVSTITLADLSYVLTGLRTATEINTNTPMPPTPSSNSSLILHSHGLQMLSTRSHVTAVWEDEDDPTGLKLNWFIGELKLV